MSDYKLCYIENIGESGSYGGVPRTERALFFTSDFENQWGDDWNDVPYEHNAGEPYMHNDYDVRCFEIHTSKDFKMPHEALASANSVLANANSIWSVEDINNGDCKLGWLNCKSSLPKLYETILAPNITIEECEEICKSHKQIKWKGEIDPYTKGPILNSCETPNEVYKQAMHHIRWNFLTRNNLYIGRVVEHALSVVEEFESS